MRRMLGNIAALALALGVSLATGEALLRAVVTLPLPRIQPEVRYLPHPVRRFTLAPSQTAFTYCAPVVIDARGFRVNGREPTRDTAGLTIRALGDSFTFGLGVRDEETWPAQLESNFGPGRAHPSRSSTRGHQLRGVPGVGSAPILRSGNTPRRWWCTHFTGTTS